jgi:hypothetical protein
LDNNNSVDEKESLHCHRNIHINASNIAREDFEFFISVNLERAPGSEPEWEFDGDMSHDKEEDTEDWVSQTVAHYATVMVQRRRQINKEPLLQLGFLLFK